MSADPTVRRPVQIGIEGGMLLLSFALGVALSPSPLFSQVGYESMFIYALLSPFLLAIHVHFVQKISRTIFLHCAGLVLFTGSLIGFAPGDQCDWVEGLGWMVMSPGLGGLFSLAVVRLYYAKSKAKRLGVALLLLLAIVVVPVLWRFYFTPQIFFFNPIFGFYAGSIYDEAVSLEWRYVFYRGATIVVILGLIGIAEPFSTLKARVSVVWFGLYVMIAWNYEAHAVTSSYTGIKHSLAHLKEGESWYGPSMWSEREKEAATARIEREIASLSEVLGLKTQTPLTIFIYPDGDMKRRFTGADETEFTKIWRREIHITAEHFSRVLRHELVHVMMGEDGLAGLGISMSIGMIEGIAVALETPNDEWTLHQLAHALMDRGFAPNQLETLLTARGFWTGLGATNYTLMGSFVSDLIDRYGIDRFRMAYARANFEEVFGKSASELIRQWRETVLKTAYPEELSAYLEYVFNRPSLFTAKCPHRDARLMKSATRAHKDHAWDQAEIGYSRLIDGTSKFRNAALMGLLQTRLRRYTEKRPLDSLVVQDVNGEFPPLEFDDEEKALKHHLEQVKNRLTSEPKMEPISYLLYSAGLWSGVLDQQECLSHLEVISRSPLSATLRHSAHLHLLAKETTRPFLLFNPYLNDSLKRMIIGQKMVETDHENAIDDTAQKEHFLWIALWLQLPYQSKGEEDSLSVWLLNQITDEKYRHATWSKALLPEMQKRLLLRLWSSGRRAEAEALKQHYLWAIAALPTAEAKRQWVRHYEQLFHSLPQD